MYFLLEFYIIFLQYNGFISLLMFFYTEIVGGNVLNVLFSLFCFMMTNRSTWKSKYVST